MYGSITFFLKITHYIIKNYNGSSKLNVTKTLLRIKQRFIFSVMKNFNVNKNNIIFMSFVGVNKTKKYIFF